VNEIFAVGLILLAALIAGHVAQLARIPEVTGYLAVGLLIGPSALDVVSHGTLESLGFLSEVALGLILFSIGAIFEASNFRRVGRAMIRVALSETSAAFVLVSLATWLVGQPWPVALLLGVIAMETAPATTLMVLHEYDARGPLTERLLVLIALNNMCVLIAFGVASAVINVSLVSGAGWLATGYRAAHGLAWSVVGSIALGVLLGLALDLWSSRTRETGEAMILAMGVVLVGVGAARELGLSPLFVSLALGATVANVSRRGDTVLKALGSADPPLYAAFFVLAGAELQIATLGAVGVTGAAYVLARIVGKVAGATLAVPRGSVPPAVRRNLGLSMLSSSSLAVGLTIQVRSTFPELAGPISAVVLGAVLLFEVAGPLLTRRALFATDEAKSAPSLLTDEAPAEV
jgi:Kef-type K+ transport system membrane component KefB